MKIEVGKFYKRRNGEKVYIHAERFPHTFLGYIYHPCLPGVDSAYYGSSWGPNGEKPISDLVEEWAEPSKQDELTELLATANAGLRALARLKKDYADQVIQVSPSDLHSSYRGAWECLLDFSYGNVPSFEAKPKTFEPFVIGNWRVEPIDSRRLKIGCKEFDIEDLRRALEKLLKGEHSKASVYTGTFYASRLGLRFYSKNANDQGHKLSYDDADKLLAALEKASK